MKNLTNQIRTSIENQVDDQVSKQYGSMGYLIVFSGTQLIIQNVIRSAIYWTAREQLKGEL